ncbi:MAG: hypothetical protein GX552_12375 [Chloroflexi bacterium]|jgi:hypothetical protein|nr:hypothetical protein [Chloroflexota bacterium]
MLPQDRNILRELAKQVAEIAALPVQQETIAAWKALNSLNPIRPMFMIDQIPWHEMDVDGELQLRTEDQWAQGIETRLRRIIYSWKHMRADMVVEPFLDIPKVIRSTGFGIQTVEEQAITDPRNDVVGHRYIDQLKTEEDVAKIRAPEISLDKEATARVEEQARDIFDDILPVRMQGMSTMFNLWDLIATWRSADAIVWDMVDRPEHMHAIMRRVTDAYMSMVNQLEEQGLLAYAQPTIHCSGAYSDELPAPGMDPARPRTQDAWTCGMAQIFATVSPAMHQEFELDYVNPCYERFGLVYYGCCEPLHNKIDIIKRIPNVRKVSMSPWVDLDKGAERIGRDLVFSRKPNPAFLMPDTWDPETVENDLRDTLQRTARHGCPLEFILKDISTVRYQPQRLWEWNDIARRVVEGG